jgi:hypothetical protein
MNARIRALVLGFTLSVVPVSTIAAPPVEMEFQFVFDDINPCTGLVHTVTISGTSLVQARDDHFISVSARTITTSPTGFVGHGTDMTVENQNIFHIRLLDVLTNAAGERIRAKIVLIVDASSGTVRLQKGAVVCLGPKD